MRCTSIVIRARIHYSVACSIVFSANPVRRYERCRTCLRRKIAFEDRYSVMSMRYRDEDSQGLNFYQQVQPVELPLKKLYQNGHIGLKTTVIIILMVKDIFTFVKRYIA